MNKTITDSEKKDNRVRNWTFLIYPESAPTGWIEKLRELKLECILSPLHDKDVNSDKTKKKPHYHVILLFSGKKSYEQIKKITDGFNAPRPEPVRDVRAMTRYLAHLDDDDKEKYNTADIQVFGGADIANLLKPTMTSKYQMLAEMVDYIESQDVREFIDFLVYCRHDRFQDWFPILFSASSNTIKDAIKSNRYKKLLTGRVKG